MIFVEQLQKSIDVKNLIVTSLFINKLNRMSWWIAFEYEIPSHVGAVVAEEE